MKTDNEVVEYYKELYNRAKKRQKDDIRRAKLDGKSRVKYYKELYEQKKRKKVR